MQTVGLSWQHSFEVATTVGALGCGLALAPRRGWRTVGAFLREAAIIGYLYGLWHLAGELSVTDNSGAFVRARWIEHFEPDLLLPSERTVQHLVLGHRYVVEAANLYYATMHFTMMLVFLIWLFVRHREHYRPVRQVMAWTTLGCLLVQLMPVAPPRMLPGVVDTALLYNQSVYSNGLAADQLSAMPSVHAAWAILVGYYAWRVSTSRWRYLGPAHAAITVFVVLVTGNHYWLDCIVAALLLILAAWTLHGARKLWRDAVRPRLAVLMPMRPSGAQDGDVVAATVGGRG